MEFSSGYPIKQLFNLSSMKNHLSGKLTCFLLLLCIFLSAQEDLLLKNNQTIYFAFGKAELPNKMDSILAPVLELVQNGEQLLIKINAHTDAIGNEAANQQLSRKRAEAVRLFLIDKGIADSLLRINTHGENQPIAENETDEGRQQNRRVTVEVYQKLRTTIISGKVTDKETQEGIRADIVLHGKMFRDSFSTDSSGNWQRKVPAEVVLGIDVFAPNYFYETQMIKTTLGKNKLIEVSIPFLKPGMAIPIKHLYFYGNSDRFLPRSLPELPKLLKFLLYNDTIQVEIAGHVNVPSKRPGFASQEEFNLSVRRAKAVYNFLIENHIRSERLRFKGYGNSEMRFPNRPDLKEQEMNRRVEVKVLGSGKVISEEKF